jgi:c(7)-type cytochrome triheme protein
VRSVTGRRAAGDAGAHLALQGLLALSALLAMRPLAAQEGTALRQLYEGACAGCHATGVLDAPRFGDAAAWTARAKAGGVDALVRSAVAGTAKGMPPKGGRADLGEAQIRALVEFMMSGGGAPARAAPAAPTVPAAPAAPTVPAAPAAPTVPAAPAAPTVPAAPAAPTVAAAPAAPTVPAAPAATATSTAAAARALVPSPAPSAEVNAFNRLLKPLARVNRPAVESGIHDPANDMTLQLQPPAVAFAGLPRAPSGNHIDWVKALDAKAIQPRWDRQDPAAKAIVMDLNIVREVKGSMPDVVYPHKQHTEWLDCSNCHPAIFVPQKGANQLSMASILLGQGCGVCHGKVAFPVSECRLCHSRKKTTTTAAGRP